MSAQRPTISVVVCTCADERLAGLLECVASVRGQTHPPLDLVVVVDHNPPLLERIRETLSGARIVANEGPRGLSSARNSGVAAARGEVVAFLDDDAAAEPDWLERIAADFSDERVVGVGGGIVPDWRSGRPRWFPEEFDWVVGCTYRGLPSRPAPLRNLIGANMSFRRSALETVGGFAPEIGQTGSSSLGRDDDTEVSIRVRRSLPGSLLLYEPAARVRHRVPPGRATRRYFRRRCFAEGLAKATLTGICGAGEGLSSERAYVVRVLLRGIARGFGELLAGDRAGPERALAIAAGLLTTTAGYAVGRARALPRRALRGTRAKGAAAP